MSSKREIGRNYFIVAFDDIKLEETGLSFQNREVIGYYGTLEECEKNVLEDVNYLTKLGYKFVCIECLDEGCHRIPIGKEFYQLTDKGYQVIRLSDDFYEDCITFPIIRTM